VDVASRADLKSDLLKELEAKKSTFIGYRGNPAIAESALEATIGKIDHAFNGLNQLPGKAGHALTTNEWLMSIRSRISIPGGTCEFDLPAYHAWQKLDAARRRADLMQWITSLMPLAEALNVLLGLLRDSGVPHKVVATGGQYQQSLPAGRTYQLMRVPHRQRHADSRDQRPPADGLGAAHAAGHGRPLEGEHRRHHLRTHAVFLRRCEAIRHACSKFQAHRHLPHLRRRKHLLAREPLPALLQRTLQERRLRSLGERELPRRGQAHHRRPGRRRSGAPGALTPRRSTALP